MGDERTRHRVYVASSWRNPIQQDVVRALRADGHTTYDYRNPAEGETGFSWLQLGDRFGKCSACGETDPLKKVTSCPKYVHTAEKEAAFRAAEATWNVAERGGFIGHASSHEWVGGWDAEYFANEVLDHPVAAHGFELDMMALRACSACVLVLPCGWSAHLELGYAVGKGRLTIVYMPKLEEPELMYRLCDYVETTLEGVRKQLSRERDAPRWQSDLTGGVGVNRSATLERCELYRHRVCEVCRGCWRHGSCTCGPAAIQ